MNGSSWLPHSTLVGRFPGMTLWREPSGMSVSGRPRASTDACANALAMRTSCCSGDCHPLFAKQMI